ncbi:Uncharacterised protein [uncultured archaeon]|nr:Uncharacterised protein [uncultured archaeon]
MAESDPENSEYIQREMLNELTPRLFSSYQMLQELSGGQDPLLKLMKIEKVKEGEGRIVIGKMSDFIKSVGLNEAEMLNPKAYYAFRKYHAMICAKIRFRERASLDSSVQGLTEYVDLLSQKLYGKPSEYSDFIDFKTQPARILPLFRQYAEITESELEKLCSQRNCSNRNDILLNIFIKMAQGEVKRLEEKLFIH